MASVNKIMCFVRGCNTSTDFVFHLLNKTWGIELLFSANLDEIAKEVAFYGAITKHGKFNTEIVFSRSVNREIP